MGRRSTVSKFPVARIKKIMQADEDVGKVAQATPVVVSKALEQFLTALVTETVKQTESSQSRKVTTSHLKRTINSNEQFDFCKDLVEKVPDVADVPSTSSAPTTIRRRGPAKDKDDSERPAKKPRVYKKKVKKEDEDDDLVTEDEDEGEGGSGAKYEDEEEEEEEKFRPGSGSVPIGNMMMSSNTSADYEEATLPNFNGGGMIRHSSNYIPPGGPPSVPSFSNQNNWGQRSSSSSSSFTSNHQAQHTFLNPAASSQIPPQPSSASWGSTPSPTKPLAPKAPTSVGFGAASSTVWAPKTGGLPPPRFAPGGGEK